MKISIRLLTKICHFNSSNRQLIAKILKAKETNFTGPVGQIIDKNFIIGCLKNSIQVLEVKKEGKNKMKALDFLRGNNLKVGTNVN